LERTTAAKDGKGRLGFHWIGLLGRRELFFIDKIIA
jgi:hypothetical protein